MTIMGLCWQYSRFRRGLKCLSEHSFLFLHQTTDPMYLALSVTAGAVVFTALIFLTIFRNLDPAIVRDGYRPCAGGWHEAHLRHCHLGLTHIPQQPINTYSNLAYVAAGLFPAVLLGTPPSYVFAATMLYLCIGSTLYHATSTRWAGVLDVTAIYSVFAALAVYAVSLVVRMPVWLTTGLMFVVAGLAAYLLSRNLRQNMNLRIGIFLGISYAMVLLRMALTGHWSAWPYLAGSLAAFAVAYLIWNMDRAQTFPLRGWGHGIWHVLAAVASLLVFGAIHLTP